jgi:predicted choloylglycine hydrolase
MTGRKDDNTASVASNMYIVEMYPEVGIPTLGMVSFELYGLALDGINAEGLNVTHLYADAVNPGRYKPTGEYGVGINEMLAVQLILDNCRNVKEAKEVLLRNKHFYMYLHTHLLVADRYGNSFVWEYSAHHNQEYIIDSESEPPIITNFPLHEFRDTGTFPYGVDEACPFARFRTLKKAMKSVKTYSNNDIKEINALVFITDEMFETKPPARLRTVYHNIYNTAERSMEISFYRKDEGDKQLRTEYFNFQLK